jgi:SPP1 gp7 family putative phage head morphogenesis protein
MKELNPTNFNDEFLIKGVYEGVYSVQLLPQKLYNFHYSNNMGAVGWGFGLPTDFLEGTKAWEAAVKYKKNIEFFSGAKEWWQVKDLSDNVFNADGIKRSFKEFREIAKGYNEQYNVNYLRTEQNAAFALSQSAEQWQQIEDEKDIFPLLQYVTVGDGRVRPEHAQWDGVILPVDDPFWDEWNPPNDWGCRCRTIQLRDGIVSQINQTKNDNPVFANNPGKTGTIFPKSGHPYFDLPSDVKKESKNNFGLVTPSDDYVRKIMKDI